MAAKTPGWSHNHALRELPRLFSLIHATENHTFFSLKIDPDH
jgi:hypothetical protein